MPTPTPETGARAFPSRRSLRTGERTPSTPPVDTGSIRVPYVEHVPATEIPATTPPARIRVPFRRRLAGIAAAASVCGLVLTLALPLTEHASVAAGAGAVHASQQLFSEVSIEDLPPSFAEISASISDESAPIAYVFDPDALVNYPFAQPVTLTDGFGYRTAPVAQFHDAQDFAAAAGTPIQAIADGTVLEAGFASDGCGFGLKLEHELDGTPVTSRYCHMQMNSHDLAVGDTVEMGDPVGTVGNTGMSFGPHLHLALRVDDEPVDPMPFFAEFTRKDRPSATGAERTTES
ncbi:M23 family metallopeptidase [Leucobacter triazinivorans]|uniref:M23 family metallopeptidase n=1 Tax=Leucobacter triazinivorans TaxID=1784719 RepID=A0A4P6KBD9_9MICO|nr:M23 family metallopeptidase [Leucobacter triazinivorans]QBE47596.1 M23 family metallopeptidase [Leucobacter triazinivorans]